MEISIALAVSVAIHCLVALIVWFLTSAKPTVVPAPEFGDRAMVFRLEGQSRVVDTGVQPIPGSGELHSDSFAPTTSEILSRWVDHGGTLRVADAAAPTPEISAAEESGERYSGPSWVGEPPLFPPPLLDDDADIDVILDLDVNGSGRIVDVSVARTSGFKTLDDAAIELAYTYRFDSGSPRSIQRRVVYPTNNVNPTSRLDKRRQIEREGR